MKYKHWTLSVDATISRTFLCDIPLNVTDDSSKMLKQNYYRKLNHDSVGDRPTRSKIRNSHESDDVTLKSKQYCNAMLINGTSVLQEINN